MVKTNLNNRQQFVKLNFNVNIKDRNNTYTTGNKLITHRPTSLGLVNQTRMFLITHTSLGLVTYTCSLSLVTHTSLGRGKPTSLGLVTHTSLGLPIQIWV